MILFNWFIIKNKFLNLTQFNSFAFQEIDSLSFALRWHILGKGYIWVEAWCYSKHPCNIILHIGNTNLKTISSPSF
jgi:hypothetical protein